MNSYRKMMLLAALFLLALTSVRIVWLVARSEPLDPAAQKGVLDLRPYGLPGGRTMNLDGEWEFYPSQLLEHVEAEAGSAPVFAQVPGLWDSERFERGGGAYGYGTYRLRILLPEGDHEVLGLSFKDVKQGSALYVNGRYYGGSGKPSAEAESFVSGVMPYEAFFVPSGNELEIMVQVSADGSYRYKGGITKPVSFGTAAAIQREKAKSIMLQGAVISLLLLAMLVVLMTYLLGTRSRLLLSLLLGLGMGAGTLFISDDKLGMELIPLTYGGVIKVTWFLVPVMVAACFDFIVRLLLPARVNRRYRVLMGIFCFWMLLAALLPARTVASLDLLNRSLSMGFLLAIIAVIVIAVLRGKEDSIYLLLAGSSMVSNLLWSTYKNHTTVNMGFYPVDLIVVFLSLSAYAMRQYFRKVEQAKELALRLQQEDRRKDEFLANTSHELRNPLHGMMNIAQTLLESERKTGGADVVRNLELLLTIGGRMSWMLGDLLEQARLREKGVKLQLAPVQLQPLAAGVIDMLAYLTEKKPVRLQALVAPDFPPVLADEMRLIQILFNLVHNALKFTEEGSVTISARLAGKEAELEVRDTGIGMDEAAARKVFEAYEQRASGYSAAGGGFGLGLSISKKLVELHGGTIQLQTAPGKGTAFFFRLPLAQTAAAPAETCSPLQEESFPQQPELPPAAHLPGRTDKPRVLMVDDDPVNLKILTGVLSPDQYRIATAGGGREALKRIEEEEWDLLISDVMMPGMSGYELTAILRTRYSLLELPVLLLTARSTPEDIQAGFRAGANDYVAKPVNAVELRTRVEGLTRLKQTMDELLRMEGAYLQAQIEPHFLFNAMNSISALGNLDAERMRRMIDAFSSYLRISFDFLNTKDVVPLRYELELVKAYLYIEQERFGQRLAVKWELEEEAETSRLMLPPYSIQPLVENAVKHGILSRSQGGQVTVRIQREGDSVLVAVEDDGAGMDEARCAGLLQPAASPGSRGVGLMNTDRRLRKRYGSGLSIASRPGQGTAVSFKIPKRFAAATGEQA
ncbi:ATP-binding protein [Paenibacillus sp. YN15]|uniref:ATP-binding response regulator n=1 Tax=Paenibacillus sp. YN15 TaxID=1742774 RepID=UPI000DCE8F62|nr:ATP-binding protein [Paenibacillus sp. YN15]RAU96371.1 histidine kinase [Paenibacillus sp. YN15]